MTGICDGRVVIVTGAARGIGRAHALEFARQGAQLVVNDIGAELDGTGGSPTPIREVADDIAAGSGEAVVNGDDVADWGGARRLRGAGVERDRMFVSCGEDEWDAVVRVHLKGHFAVSRFAAEHWRERAKAGEAVDARVVNAASGAGLQGSVGQAAYSAAKAGIAALTLVQAAELGRYGVTANAIAPSARTRMTETVFADMLAAPTESGAFDAMSPDNVAPLAAWLGSPESAHVTGRVFEVEGGKVSLADGWQHGPASDKGARWEPAELGPVVEDLLAR